jgi:hypothetical protein
MDKKKKNSTAYLELRTGAFGILTLTAFVVIAYSSFGILVSWLISQNSSEPRTDLNITILTLAIAVFLLLRFTWFNGKRLWIEWQSRQKAKRAGVEYQDFSHLEDNLGDEESDYLDMQSLTESNAKS